MRNWLLKLLIGKKPVVANVPFPNGVIFGAMRGGLIFRCTVSRSE